MTLNALKTGFPSVSSSKFSHLTSTLIRFASDYFLEVVFVCVADDHLLYRCDVVVHEFLQPERPVVPGSWQTSRLFHWHRCAHCFPVAISLCVSFLSWRGREQQSVVILKWLAGDSFYLATKLFPSRLRPWRHLLPGSIIPWSLQELQQWHVLPLSFYIGAVLYQDNIRLCARS